MRRLNSTTGHSTLARRRSKHWLCLTLHFIFQMSPILTTMGELAGIQPEDGSEAFQGIRRSIQNNYPEDWENWKVLNYSYEELFGPQISSTIEGKLRFCIPTADMVEAFQPDTTKGISERAFRAIRKTLITWPLGRALLYSPHSIVEKTHKYSYKEFMATVKFLKPNLSNRLDTNEKLSEGNSPNSLAQKRPHEKTHDYPVETTPRKRVPEQGSNDHLLASVFQQQTELLNKLLEMSAQQNKTMVKIHSSLIRETPDLQEPDLNESFESQPDSTQDDEIEEGERSTSAVPSNEIDVLKEEISAAQRRLAILQEVEDNPTTSSYNFIPRIEHAEGKYSKANPILAKQAEECQSFGKEDWNTIRYSTVQKQFQSTPVFRDLKVNNYLLRVTPNWSSVKNLEKMDLVLGAVTNGLLQQRQTFQDLCDSLPHDIQQRVGKDFLAHDSKFRKNSDNLLQYVCGRRTEIIQKRRDVYKIKNKALNDMVQEVPPSSTHLFAEPDFSTLVQEQGGIHKLFPPRAQGSKSHNTQRIRTTQSQGRITKITRPNQRPYKSAPTGGKYHNPKQNERKPNQSQNKGKGPFHKRA